MIERTKFLSLIKAAETAGRPDYARALATDWLATWPGDIEIQYLAANGELRDGDAESAAARLQNLIVADPDFEQAYQLLALALEEMGQKDRASMLSACATILRGDAPSAGQLAPWIALTAKAVQALQAQDLPAAKDAAQQALALQPDLPYPVLLAIRIALASGDSAEALELARRGLDRWPGAIVFRVLIAQHLLAEGETHQGVAYLHQVVADDPMAWATRRILGRSHPYRDLWPQNPAAPLNRPIPAEVGAIMGNNQISAPKLPRDGGIGVTPPDQKAENQETPPKQDERRVFKPRPAPQDHPPIAKEPDTQQEPDLPKPFPWESYEGPDPGNDYPDAQGGVLEAAESSLEQPAESPQPEMRIEESAEDARLPAYIVLSSRTKLLQMVGQEAAQRVDTAITDLVAAVRARHGWNAYHIYIDEPETLTPLGLTPADPGNAWQIKLRLADLDRSLGRKGEMIGALLIVGSHEIVPFHMLPNPTDDDDDAVASDNPYATPDENYLAPEWPIGRLPSHDAALLISMLTAASEEHRRANQQGSLLWRLWTWLQTFFGRLTKQQAKSLGYSASIWRKASMAVYRSIGEPRELVTSPPAEAEALPPILHRPSHFSYFNLHGLQDAAEWFGQRDPLRDPARDTEFPVALRPQDVVNSGRAPRIVFTEACYGAHAMGKTPSSALCLKFLSSGSRALVGSTMVSYGSLAPPLIAADYLGRRFWEHLRAALPAGDALRRAKLELAAEMHSRQGFLDGEDQKTITSFLLYGDPLTPATPGSPAAHQKVVTRRTERPRLLATVCARDDEENQPPTLDEVALGRVRSIVSRYLPGMADASYAIHAQRYSCSSKDHTCATQHFGRLSERHGRETLLVTFSKQFIDTTGPHRRYARLTLDNTGRVLKLAVSR